MILQTCPILNEELVVWYGECMVRSAYRNFISLLETDQSYNETSVDKVLNVSDLVQILRDALMSVILDAANDPNGIYFATSVTDVTASEKIYSLAQCTRDLNAPQCQSCLETALTQMYASTWAFVYRLSCQLRYDNKSFFVVKESVALSPSPSTTMLPPADRAHEAPSISTLPTSAEKKSLKPGIIAAITSAASLGFLFLVGCLCVCLRRTKPGGSFEKMSEASDQFTEVLQDGTVEDISNLEALQVDFSVVKAATSNFSEENKLGQGGFGEVYKGTFPSGQAIAVKRLSKNSQQGNVEFKNEVILLAKLQHRNLVRLLGFCLLRAEKILIYEFLTNSSLDHFLYNPEKRASLDWQLRFKITMGITRGLLYLHEDSRLKIIHRDLKVSNILLDEAMNAKIADFGLAKLFDLDQTQGDTMRIAGTYGYMAPEYALAGQFSVKSDVYSFGVIVLEIVSGQRNSFFKQHSDEGLIHRAWRLWNEDTILELVDPLLDNNYSEEEAKLCIQIGLLCIQEDAAYRPRMASVVSAINGQAITLPVPNAPLFYAIATMNNNDMSSILDSVLGSEAQHSNSDHSNGELVGNVLDINPR